METKTIERIVRQADRLLERRIRGLTVRVERQKNNSPKALEDLEQLLRVASSHHVRRPATIWRYGLRVGHSYSLHAELLKMRLYSHETNTFPAHWKIDDKRLGHDFIDLLNIVRRPNTLSAGHSIAELPIEAGLVVKPEKGAGARGCYVPTARHEWRHVKTNEILQGAEDLRQHAALLTDPRKNRTVLEDQWKTEEFITENRSNMKPARDVKFYCFYGEVGLAFEIERHPKRQFSSIQLGAAGNPRQFERPFRGDYHYFEGAGLSFEELDIVRHISRSIPAPFMSIDMLRAEDGLVFSEFTPHPIATRDLTPTLDRKLGQMWHSAQHRLTQDLLHGEPFHSFKHV